MQFVNPTWADWRGDGRVSRAKVIIMTECMKAIYNSMHEAGSDNAEWIRKHTAQSSEL